MDSSALREEIANIIMNGLAYRDFRMSTMGGKLNISFGDYAYQFDTPMDFPARIIRALEETENNNEELPVFRLDPAAQDG